MFRPEAHRLRCLAAFSDDELLNYSDQPLKFSHASLESWSIQGHLHRRIRGMKSVSNVLYYKWICYGIFNFPTTSMAAGFLGLTPAGMLEM